MTEEDLDAIQARHRPGASHGSVRYCTECCGKYPCDVALLVAELRRLRDDLEDLRDRSSTFSQLQRINKILDGSYERQETSQ